MKMDLSESIQVNGSTLNIPSLDPNIQGTSNSEKPEKKDMKLKVESIE